MSWLERNQIAIDEDINGAKQKITYSYIELHTH